MDRHGPGATAHEQVGVGQQALIGVAGTRHIPEPGCEFDLALQHRQMNERGYLVKGGKAAVAAPRTVLIAQRELPNAHHDR